ncbi:MAG: FAD-dependent monooxygenase [Pseudomonadota bacterium]
MVTVLGAGIGGLTLALALARKGARVSVLEQADALRDVGAGIQLSPNAMQVLRALGVGQDIAEKSPEAMAVELCDYQHGKSVLRLDFSGMTDLGGYHLVHRADLIEVLAKAARDAGASLKLGVQVQGLALGAGGVRLDAGDKGHATAPLVVAADGLKSIARRALGPAPDPKFTGQTAWRALVSLAVPVKPEVRVFMGPGRHLVCYPLRDGHLMNLVAVKEQKTWRAEGWDIGEDPIALQEAFADFGGPVPDLLERVTQTHVWGLFRHPVPSVWHRGRLALMGDAVHPTLPFLAQGACMAIEDAWVLTESLSAHESPAEAFAAYQTARLRRCRRIVAAANRNAWAYHLSLPLFREAAHLALGVSDKIFPGAALRRFDWLYCHDVTQAQI